MIMSYLVLVFISSSFSLESVGCGFDDEFHRKYNKKLPDEAENDGTESAIETNCRGSTCWDDLDNIIPYYFASSIRTPNRRKIKEQMKKIEKHTCIQFRELGEDEISTTNHRVKINHTDNDAIGRDYCNSASVTIYGNPVEIPLMVDGLMHELGHVLGLLHTHRRFDREKYVHVNQTCIEFLTSNEIITEERAKDFEKIENDEDDDTHNIPYKCNFIMHYPEYWDEYCSTFIAEPQFKKEDCIGGKIGMLDEPLDEDWDLINQEHCSNIPCSQHAGGSASRC